MGYHDHMTFMGSSLAYEESGKFAEVARESLLGDDTLDINVSSFAVECLDRLKQRATVAKSTDKALNAMEEVTGEEVSPVSPGALFQEVQSFMGARLYGDRSPDSQKRAAALGLSMAKDSFEVAYVLAQEE
jgi:hypothetical protein